MGRKVDSSFLRNLTIGALGVRRVWSLMTQAGLQPVELERSSGGNKIWDTKVKRLRLPDLLCLRTGLRVEVRGKSALAIRMSESPSNPDRLWNSGLRDNDMVAFVLVREDPNGSPIAAETAELFWAGDLGAAKETSRLGPPKSASEGAERDRTWPSIVPTQSGMVHSITSDRLSVTTSGGRRQTYSLNQKTAYLSVGESFAAGRQFLAGAPRQKATFPNPGARSWNPRDLLSAGLSIDRYVGVKALGYSGSQGDVETLAAMALSDADSRVALEAAASLVRLGDRRGLEFLSNAIDTPAVDYLRMEAALALSEFKNHSLTADCVALLLACAKNRNFEHDEVRQAAIWGLGKEGLASYNSILEFIDATDVEEAVHAVHAFGGDADASVIDALISILCDFNASIRKRSSASFILGRIVEPMLAIPRLLTAYQTAEGNVRDWLLATLGQISPAEVKSHVADRELIKRLEPLLLLSPENNWMRSEKIAPVFAFVSQQTVDS